jgi:hypothetical protein
MTGPPGNVPERAERSVMRRTAMVWMLCGAGITFGYVLYLGWARLSENPMDVFGTGLLFAALVGILAYRFGWRFRARQMRKG